MGRKGGEELASWILERCHGGEISPTRPFLKSAPMLHIVSRVLTSVGLMVKLEFRNGQKV